MSELTLIEEIDLDRHKRRKEIFQRKQDAITRWEADQFYDVFFDRAFGFTLIVHHSDAWKTQEIKRPDRYSHFIILGKLRAAKLARWMESHMIEASYAHLEKGPYDPRASILAKAGLYEAQP